MRIRTALFTLLIALTTATLSTAATPDKPFPAAEAASHMTLPEGFNATLFAGEPDLVQPIAFCFDHRGRLWVAECTSYPAWDTKATATTEGHDRILIFEDTDGDGKFNKKTVFYDKAVNLSGIELGFGGVWLCSAPNLLFIPINEAEDKPAGPPQAVLDGWNVKDSKHNIFNRLTWAPDGWLYGCNGIMAPSSVGAPGTPDDQRIKMNCGVWRYHPTRKIFEAVAHGTTNPWGMDFDELGQIFITNCVISHLWHVIPGAHYQRMYGQDINPNSYALMPSIADHFHFAGGGWKDSVGNQSTLQAGGGHAHVGAMVYLGDNWPDTYRGQIFMCNIHGSRVNNDILEPKASGYVAHHNKDFLLANDPWFRGIDLHYGPDGGVYVSDWTDTGECHNYITVDRTNGRIYKINYGKPAPVQVDLQKLSDAELVKLQLHKNEWFVRQARLVLQERTAAGKLDPATKTALTQLLQNEPTVVHKLRAIWTLHAIGALEESTLLTLLQSPEPYIRNWAIHLAMEDKKPSAAFLQKMTDLAKSDPSPVVRLALSSTLQRLPLENRWNIAANLIAHAEDSADANLPLLTWYGLEPLVAADTPRALALIANTKWPIIREYIAHRAATDKLEPLVKFIGATADADIQRDTLRGLFVALKGQRHLGAPAGWHEVSAQLEKSAPGDIRDTVRSIGAIFGDEASFAALRDIAKNVRLDRAEREAAVEALILGDDPQLIPVLRELLPQTRMHSVAIKGLAVSDDPAVAKEILEGYDYYGPKDQQNALQTLVSRPTFALVLLDGLEHKHPARADLSMAMLRQLAAIKDDQVKKRVEQVLGTIHVADKNKAPIIAKFKKELTSEVLANANPTNGRGVFDRTCAACHTLFDAGGKVGPNLTGGQRAVLDYLLENVVDPNAIVAKEYKMTVAVAKDGRTINGIIISENEKALTLRTANEDISLPLSEITERWVAQNSMMPEGLLESLSPDDARDLVAYLGSPRQVAPPATQPARPATAK